VKSVLARAFIQKAERNNGIADEITFSLRNECDRATDVARSVVVDRQFCSFGGAFNETGIQTRFPRFFRKITRAIR